MCAGVKSAMLCLGQCLPQQSMPHLQKTDKPAGDALGCLLCVDIIGEIKNALKDPKLQVVHETMRQRERECVCVCV